MERFKTFARWAAVAIAGIALAIAMLPHRQDTTPVADDSPPPVVTASSAAPASVESPLASPAPFASPAPSSIAVYVCGAVRKPGVFKLAPGSRVVDAVDDAGGLTKDADDEAINLAQPLVDGVKVDVPRKGQRTDPPAGDVSTGSPVTAATHSTHSSHHHSSGRSSTHKLQPGQTLDINTASESELTQLPGVGPSLARRIVEYRQANGPFTAADDIQNVSGVGPSKFAKMEPFIRI